VDIETDVEHGCLLKSLSLGNAATEFQVTRPTGASFIVSTPKQSRARHQTYPPSAVHGPADSILAARTAETGSTIRCSRIGGLP
jgi:hypothetical protein